MYCQNCGKNNDVSFSYCTSCGTKLAKDSGTEAPSESGESRKQSLSAGEKEHEMLKDPEGKTKSYTALVFFIIIMMIIVAVSSRMRERVDILSSDSRAIMENNGTVGADR